MQEILIYQAAKEDAKDIANLVKVLLMELEPEAKKKSKHGH